MEIDDYDDDVDSFNTVCAAQLSPAIKNYNDRLMPEIFATRATDGNRDYIIIIQSVN